MKSRTIVAGWYVFLVSVHLTAPFVSCRYRPGAIETSVRPKFSQKEKMLLMNVVFASFPSPLKNRPPSHQECIPGFPARASIFLLPDRRIDRVESFQSISFLLSAAVHRLQSGGQRHHDLHPCPDGSYGLYACRCGSAPSCSSLQIPHG